MIKYLFSRLFDGVVIDLHLLREVFFKPLILLNVVVDELHCQLPVNLYGCLACLAVVEPCLRPPSDPTLVWIYTHQPRYVETLNVNLQLGKRVDESAAGYGTFLSFFFSSADIVLRKT